MPAVVLTAVSGAAPAADPAAGPMIQGVALESATALDTAALNARVANLPAARAALAPMPAAPEPVSKPAVETVADDPPPDLGRSPARHTWAMLLARLCEIFPLTCPICGAEMRIIAFITEAVDVRAILEPIGEPATPPRIASARGPPQWYVDCAMDAIDAEAGLSSDPLAQPEYEYDQRVSW